MPPLHALSVQPLRIDDNHCSQNGRFILTRQTQDKDTSLVFSRSSVVVSFPSCTWERACSRNCVFRLAKYNFLDTSVPKCNLGTRAIRLANCHFDASCQFPL